MRRKEMIEIIKSIIVIDGNTFCDDGRDNVLAHKILDTIEDFGMSPPRTIIRKEGWKDIYDEDDNIPVGKVWEGNLKVRGWERE